MSAPDRLYYAMRAEAEKLLAGQAVSPEARLIHGKLAAQYESIAKGEETSSVVRQQCWVSAHHPEKARMIAA